MVLCGLWCVGGLKMALWAFWCVWQGVTLSAWCRLCGVSVSGLVLWLSGGLLWLCVSGLAVCLWWSLWLFWCAVRGAVSLVLSCCLVSVSSLVVWCAVFWSLVVSSLVWSSGVWCLVYYQQCLKFLCTRKECHVT